MNKYGEANGLLKDVKANDTFSDEESLLSVIEEDCELENILTHRKNQDEIEIDIDNL